MCRAVNAFGEQCEERDVHVLHRHGEYRWVSRILGPEHRYGKARLRELEGGAREQYAGETNGWRRFLVDMERP